MVDNMIMNMYDYKLMEKLIIVARANNELETVRGNLEARVWWDDGFKALFNMVLKDVEKKPIQSIHDIDPTIKYQDAHVVDGQANKVKINRYVRSCLRIFTDCLDERERKVNST